MCSIVSIMQGITKTEEAFFRAKGQTALARAIGVPQQTTHRWQHAGRIPAKWCVKVSAATEWVVTPHELNPESFPYEWDGLPSHLAKQYLCNREAV